MLQVNECVSDQPTVAGGIPPNFRKSLVERSFKEAEFIRLPAPGERCPLSSLSRSTLVELGEAGLIDLKRIRKPGAVRGIVLINRRSLLAYLHSLTTTGAQAA
jgi:hypothetical protein